MKWILPGAFWHYDIYKKIKFSRSAIFYDGVNSCPWNGGRNNVIGNVWNDEIVNFYYKNNHRIALTFSNSIIDINNNTGNLLLELLSKKNNTYVIIKNFFLLQHIKRNFPAIKTIFSITGTKEQYDKKFYYSILNNYDYIVPRFHHTKDISKDFIHDLDRFEILINHTCPSTCPKWDEHYAIIEKNNQQHKNFLSYDTRNITCLIKEDFTDSSLRKLNIRKKLIYSISYGFTRFKLSGREYSKERLLKDLLEIKEFL